MEIKSLYNQLSPQQQRILKANLIKEKQNRSKRQKMQNINNAYEWIAQNQYTNENGNLMEFEDRSFLIEPLSDENKHLVVMKCSQIGFSTISIFKSIFHNVKYGHNIIYTLPTDDDAQEFAKAKTDMILEKNPSMSQGIVDNTLHTKSFRTLDESNVGFWFMKGTYGRSASIMQTADILIKDEFDRSNANVLNQYKSRTQASDYGAEWEFSNPTIRNFGVDQTWQHSDQRHYFYWCTKCNHASYITFEPENFDKGMTHHVDVERAEYICGSCKEVLDRRKAKKRWVKKYASRHISGYWISQMMAPWKSAQKLLQDKPLIMPDVWANFYLGLPYASGSNQLDRGSILANVQLDQYNRAKENPGKQNVIGVDVGGTRDNPDFYICRGTEQGLTEITKLTGEDKLYNYIRVHNITQVVIDNKPYTEVGIDLAKAFPGKVARCEFDYNDKRKNVYEYDPKRNVVHAHRTRLFDYVVESYITRNRAIYMIETEPRLSSLQTDSLCKHWARNFKVGGSGEQPEDKERIKELIVKNGAVVPTWEREGANDFSLADVYMALAQMMVERKVEIL